MYGLFVCLFVLFVLGIRDLSSFGECVFLVLYHFFFLPALIYFCLFVYLFFPWTSGSVLVVVLGFCFSPVGVRQT